MENVLNFDNLPGFSFIPSDVELIDHYVKLKNDGNDAEVGCIKDVNFNEYEPWDLPHLSNIKIENAKQWYFFHELQRMHDNDQVWNRNTPTGLWRDTKRDININSGTMGLIGVRKTLQYYNRMHPKSYWVVFEYHSSTVKLDLANPQKVFVLYCLSGYNPGQPQVAPPTNRDIISSINFGNLPLGLRFRPNDVDLINHYLRLKINGNEVGCINTVKVNMFHPSELPGEAVIKNTDDDGWFFFTELERIPGSDTRSNRKAINGNGAWKNNGSPTKIELGDKTIGTRQLHTFYSGSYKDGVPTNWRYYEYRLSSKENTVLLHLTHQEGKKKRKQQDPAG